MNLACRVHNHKLIVVTGPGLERPPGPILADGIDGFWVLMQSCSV
jgi:hypothetical protein